MKLKELQEKIRREFLKDPDLSLIFEDKKKVLSEVLAQIAWIYRANQTLYVRNYHPSILACCRDGMADQITSFTDKFLAWVRSNVAAK